MVEVTTFRLADGVDSDVFREADKEFQTGFVYAQPGLVRRTVARDDAGTWLVVTLWRSPDEADAAREQASGATAARFYAELIDGASVQSHRYLELDALP